MKCKHQGCDQEMYEKSQGTGYCRRHFDEFKKLLDECDANGIVAFFIRSGGDARKLAKKLTRKLQGIRNEVTK